MPARKRQRQRGMLMTDLFVAMGILALALIPISYSFLKEQQLCRAYYHRALATQILDGEMEVLAAGEWKALPEGEQDYSISASAAKNLPPGKFLFARTENALRLEWCPDKKEGRGKLIREALGQ